MSKVLCEDCKTEIKFLQLTRNCRVNHERRILASTFKFLLVLKCTCYCLSLINISLPAVRFLQQKITIMTEQPQSIMNTSRRIDIEVNSKPYNIFTISILYFAFYPDFQCHFEQVSEKHDNIPLFKIAYQGIKNGFHFCFQKLSTDLTKYHTLCGTLELLCINTLKG